MAKTAEEQGKHWLGWCPNHTPTVAPPAKMTLGPWVYIIPLICVLVIPAVLLLTTPAPQDVAVWVFRLDDSGVKHFVGRLPATEDSTGRLTFSTAGGATPALSPGKYSLIIEHPGKDGSFRLMLDGVNVKFQSPDSANGGTMLFKISGPGSLQQEDAYEALIAAFDLENPDGTSAPSGTSGDFTEREYSVDT
ncbi:MAG: hypothetical protein LUQ31_02020 [Methanoregula sp.]|nr:hypothetical protein [Methanoregula sp.]